MDLDRNQLADIVDKHVKELQEFFPDVQILVSWLEEGTKNTIDCFRGGGNFYARTGMAREFLQRDASATQAADIRKELDPPDPLLPPKD
jgi:hypothetical protein